MSRFHFLVGAILLVTSPYSYSKYVCDGWGRCGEPGKFVPSPGWRFDQNGCWYDPHY